MSDVSPLVQLLAVLLVVGSPGLVVLAYMRQVVRGQQDIRRELCERVQRIEGSVDQLQQTTQALARDKTDKDEWLRSAVHTDHRLGQMTEMMARIEIELSSKRSLGEELAPAVKAIAGLASELKQARAGNGQG